jgi:hypothetical protein
VKLGKSPAATTLHTLNLHMCSYIDTQSLEHLCAFPGLRSGLLPLDQTFALNHLSHGVCGGVLVLCDGANRAVCVVRVCDRRLTVGMSGSIKQHVYDVVAAACPQLQVRCTYKATTPVLTSAQRSVPTTAHRASASRRATCARGLPTPSRVCPA